MVQVLDPMRVTRRCPGDIGVQVHLRVESLRYPGNLHLEPRGSRAQTTAASPGPLSRLTMPTPSDTPPLRQQLRRQLRARRRALTPQQQQHAAQQLLARIRQTPAFMRARHIAFYLPNDGEIDPRPLYQWATSHGKTGYLPVLHPLHHGALWFVHYAPETPMRRNRFGIPEPQLKGWGQYRLHRRAPWALDMILMPLVGFDAQGGRLGMGGGFYDRTLAFTQQHPQRPRPLLVGLAHHCQQVDNLPLAHWDIPLDAIVTDQQWWDVRSP